MCLRLPNVSRAKDEGMKSRFTGAVGALVVMVGACSANDVGRIDGAVDNRADAPAVDAGGDSGREADAAVADAPVDVTLDVTVDANEAGTLDAPFDSAVDATIDSSADAVAIDAPTDVVEVGPAADALPPATFTRIYNEIIAVRCNGCHSSPTHSSLLEMTSKAAAYINLVGVNAAGSACGSSGLKRVVTGNVAASLLHQKVSGTQTCGVSMPYGATLSLSDRDLVASWIAAGAKND
jgi:hypothetical protein